MKNLKKNLGKRSPKSESGLKDPKKSGGRKSQKKRSDVTSKKGASKMPKNGTVWFYDVLFIKKTFFHERRKIQDKGGALPGLLTPVVIPNLYVDDLLKQNDLPDSKKPKNFFDSSEYCIALLDTGVRKTHQDIKGNYIELLSSNHKPEKDINDEHGHGTHIAGILAGNGIKRGIAPGASIVSYKITDGDQSHTSWVRVAEALQQVIDRKKNFPNLRKISVVNLSFNAFINLSSDQTQEEIFSETIRDQIDQLYKQNIPLVVSGGNYFDSFVKWDSDGLASNPEDSYGLAFPANHTKVFACGASCYEGKYITQAGHERRMHEHDLAPFTQRPNPAEYDPASSKKTFIATPAVATKSLGITDDKSYSVLMGSSMAAPVIAGTIFLLQHLHLDSHGSLPYVEDIKEYLFDMCTAKDNIGTSEFRTTMPKKIKPSKAFFNKEKYLHLSEEDTIKLYKKLVAAKSVASH